MASAMKWWLLTAVLLPLLVAATQWNSSFVVAFGSCSFRYSVRNLTTLVSIAKERPDYFLHIGDVVYLDTQGETLETWYPEMDLERVRSRYRQMTTSEEFNALLEQGTTIKTIWDDHDSNLNNGDTTTNKLMNQVRPIYMEEFNVENAVFNDSLHQVYQIHPLVRLLMLDPRSYKTKTEMFNDKTWLWVESEMATLQPNSFLIITSCTQMIYDDRPLEESWFPADRLKLYNLLKKYQVHAVLLSGDVHFGEIGYRHLWEVKSSGLDYSILDQIPHVTELQEYFYLNSYSEVRDRYLGVNFGLITINFEDDSQFKIKDVVMQIKTQFGELKVTKHATYDQTLVGNFDPEDIGVNHYDRFKQKMFAQIKNHPELMPLLHESGLMPFAAQLM